MKKSYYFPHDYHAREDIKLAEMRLEMGCEGIGIYWCLVEMLYENDGYLFLSKVNIYAKMLNTTAERLDKVINQYKLFQKQVDTFYSQSLIDRLKHINGKRWKAKISANKRWNANAMPTHCEGNAIKYSKVYESKVKESKVYESKVKDIIDDLNLVLGTVYKITSSKTQELIQARLNDGFTIEDFKTVHRKMLRAWGADDKMVKFLRPITLYGNKFEGYLNQKTVTTKLTPEGVRAYLVGQAWLKQEEIVDVK